MGYMIYDNIYIYILVGDLEPWNFIEFDDFPSIGNVIIPTDFHSIIFQRARWLNHQPDIIIHHH
jgi:hypothetical protein